MMQEISELIEEKSGNTTKYTQKGANLFNYYYDAFLK